MIGGIEARHAWTPQGAAEAAIVLGLTHDDEGKRVWPHAKITAITGLLSLGDAGDNSDLRVGHIGEIPRVTQRRGKTVLYEGFLRARSRKSLLELSDDVKAAFADQSRLGRMDVTWHPLNKEFEAEDDKFFEARALACEVVDLQATSRHVRKFAISVRMKDPRYFSEAEELGEASVAETGETDVFA